MGQRILIWLLIIAITFGGYFLIDGLFAEDKININYDTNETPELANLRKISKWGLEFNYNVMNPNVIISKTEKNKTDFDTYENFFYSPFVLFVGNKALYPENGFLVNNASSELYYRDIEKDLKPILLGIENNKDWKDIGINENVLSGKIQLVIPSKSTPWFNSVKELFLINLGEEITEDNIEELILRVNNIIDKCIQTESPIGYINDGNATSDTETGIKKIAVIAPECIISQKSAFGGTCRKDKEQTYYVPVYLTKTVALKYNLLIKNDIPETIRDRLFKAYNSESNIYKTCIRTNYKTPNIEKIHSNAKSSVNIQSLPENFKLLLN